MLHRESINISKRNRWVCVASGILTTLAGVAQEPQLTQFYASPTFLNPAFTGLTPEHRFTAGYRRQWPAVQKGFTTYMAGYDYNLADYNSGVGAVLMQDRAGSSNLVTTLGGLNYAYCIKVNEKADVRAGISGAFGQKKIDNASLLFSDQIITGAAVSNDAKTEPISYVDIGAGAVFNTEKLWAGISAKHLNRPAVGLYEGGEPLGISGSIHAGYRHVLSEKGTGTASVPKEYVSGAINLRKTGKNDQLDLGAYYFRSFFNVGIWYRGLPVKTYKPGYINVESVSLLLGFELPEKMLRIGYSYDYTISKLGASATGGAHEIALVYEMASPKKRGRIIRVSAPKF